MNNDKRKNINVIFKKRRSHFLKLFIDIFLRDYNTLFFVKANAYYLYYSNHIILLRHPSV